MRATGWLMAFAVAVLTGAPASARDWTEYQNPEYGFAINFPGEPEVTETTYTSPTGEALPAHIFDAEEGTSRYRVTVVDFSSREGEQHIAIAHAADAMRGRGEVIYEVYSDLDEVYGPQFMIVEPDGREMMSTIVFYNDRLYIAEGSVAPGAAEPSQFQQSMMLLNEDGSRPNGAGENADRLARQRAYEEQLERELQQQGD